MFYFTISYLNSAQHISVIELCREQLFLRFYRRFTYSFVAIYFLAFINHVEFNIYFFR